MESDDSTIQTRALKHCRRHILYSSEDKWQDRMEEVLETDVNLITDTVTIPSEPAIGEQLPSQHKNKAGISNIHSTGDVTEQHEDNASGDEIVILLSHGSDSPWESGQESDTSTPDFKRG